MSRARTILSLASALVLTLVLFTGAGEAQVDAGGSAREPHETSALPFSEQELTEALSARAPHIDPSSVRVQAAGDLFLVTLGARSRVLDLSGTRGVDAARVVALVAMDLSLREDPAEDAVTLHAPRLESLPASPSARPTSPPDRFRLGIEGSVMHGLQRNDKWGFTLGLSADYVVRRFLSTLSASYWTMPTEVSRLTLSRFQFDALSLRAGVGMQLARFSLAIGPAYARAWIRGPNGHTSDLFGVSLQGSFWLPAGKHARLGVRGYVDGYVRRSFFYAWGPELMFATPGVALGIALAVAWGWS